MTIYEAIKNEGVEYDTHESDLYIQDTPKNWELLAEYHSEFIGNVTRFRNQRTGNIWLDIPFCNDEWWAKRIK